jgi:hypothetical protein
MGSLVDDVSGWQLRLRCHVKCSRSGPGFGPRIHTSATLPWADFSLYQRALGLADARTGSWDSPFDYAAQALLYVPRDLPQPNSREHTEAVIAAALPVLRASGGRAFLLFTTLRALDIARDLLSAAIAREGLRWPLLVQGDGSAASFLRFRELGNAVLQRELSRASTAGRRVVGCRSTSCPSRRPTIAAAARLDHLRAAEATRSSSPGASGGDRAEAGRRPSVHRIGPRRIDDATRAHRQGLRPANLAEPAADAAHARARGSGSVFARRI